MYMDSTLNVCIMIGPYFCGILKHSLFCSYPFSVLVLLQVHVVMLMFVLQASHYAVMGRNIPFVIVKKQDGYWPRLLKESAKVKDLI